MTKHDFFKYYDMETGYEYTAEQANKMYHKGYDIAVMTYNKASGAWKVVATWKH